METVFVALRVVLSLAVVLGLLWVLHRRISRGSRARTGSNPIVIVGRQAVGQKSSVVIVEVDGHRMLLGVTEQQVSVLHEEEIRRASVDDIEFTRIMAEAAELRESVLSPAPIRSRTPAPRPMPIDAPVPATPHAVAAQPTPSALPILAGQPTLAGQLTPAGHPTPAGQPTLAAHSALATASQPTFAVDPAITKETAPMLSGSILSAATWKQAAAALRLGK